MKNQPPRLAKNILRRFCHVSFIEEVEGDLDEQFFEHVEESGLFRARLQYWIDVIRAVASGNRQPAGGASARMSIVDSLSHFFKIFFRSLKHGSTSAIINITGLVLSLVSFVAIWLYVNDEFSFNQFHPDADKTYRISHSYKRFGDGVPETDARVPGLWIGELADAMPRIETHTRFSKFGGPGFVKYEETGLVLEEPNVFWVDTTYTDIFHLKITRGSQSKEVFKDPSRIIISESTARKYFAHEDPIGK